MTWTTPTCAPSTTRPRRHRASRPVRAAAAKSASSRNMPTATLAPTRSRRDGITDMKIIVTLENEAGELDSRVVGSERDAKFAALELIGDCAWLQDGDRIFVREIIRDAVPAIENTPTKD